MGKTLGIVTLGQSPRSEVTAALTPFLGPDIDIIEAGALDDAGPGDLAALRPEAPETTLVSRLRDGSPVLLDRDKLAPRLQERVDRVEARGADLTVLLSTGSLPPLRSGRPLVRPEHLLRCAAEVLLPGGVLGVVVPLQRQLCQARSRWQSWDGRVIFDCATPFNSEGVWGQAAERMLAAHVEMVVLDSFAYSADVKRELELRCRLPVILAVTMVGRLLAEVM